MRLAVPSACGGARPLAARFVRNGVIQTWYLEIGDQRVSSAVSIVSCVFPHDY